MVIEGAADTEGFPGDAHPVLVPRLRPGDIVVMDNRSPHKQSRDIAARESRGAAVWRLPPRGPDLNPIETMGSKIKAFLREAKAARGTPCSKRSATPCNP